MDVHQVGDVGLTSSATSISHCALIVWSALTVLLNLRRISDTVDAVPNLCVDEGRRQETNSRSK